MLLVKSHPVTVAVPELDIAPPYNDIYPSSVSSFVCSFVHASVIISQERKEEEGSKSTRPTEARQGQQLRENRNSPNQDQDHHVETNKQTTIKLATYSLRFIIHGYACIRCHRVFVRVFVRSFVCACVRHHITKRERKKKGVSQGARQRLDRDNNREKTETVQTKTSRRKQQTNHNQACHLHTEIHHSWVSMYPLSSCVRPFV